MARKEKPLRLVPVDDAVIEAVPVVRLGNRPKPKGKAAEPKPVRLVVPEGDEVELRTHQPGVEAISEPFRPQVILPEQSWGEAATHRNPLPWGWFALLGLVIGGAVLWSLGNLETGDTKAALIRNETESALVLDQQEEQEAARLIDRIDKTTRDFMTAGSVEALARLVRHHERVTPLMRIHYGQNPLIPMPVKAVRTFEPITFGNRGNFWLASVVVAGGEVKTLLLEVTESGQPLVDWETFVCYQPLKWDDFARRKANGVPLDFRVHVERDDFFSHEFADTGQWLCFRLTALGGEETLFGYVRADSDEAAELLQPFEETASGRVAMILRLVSPEGLKSRSGVMIEKLVAPRWVFMDPPDSGS